MKISFILTSIDSAAGTERAIITQANSLVAAGFDVDLHSVYRSTGTPSFALDAKVTIHYWLEQESLTDISGTTNERDPQNYGSKPSRLIPAEWDDQFNLLTDLVAGRVLPTLTSDVVVTTTPALGLLAGTYIRPETVVVAQEHRATMSRGKGFTPLALASQQLDCIVSLTDASNAWLAERLHGSGVRLESIPNALPDVFRPQSTTEEKAILAAGRFAPGKQFAHLIDAFSRISSEYPDWILRIYGSGPLEETLKSQAVRLNIAGKVQIVPPVKSLELEWPKGSILGLASRSEGLPLVIMEAAGAGIPTVSYDCQTGPAELIEDGVSGILVPPNNVTSLAAALEKLMGDDGLRYRMGQAAKTSIGAYAPSKIEATWQALYGELVAEASFIPSRSERNAARFAAMQEVEKLERSEGGQNASEALSRGDVIVPLTVLEAGELGYADVLFRNRQAVKDVLHAANARMKTIEGYHGYRDVFAVPDEDRLRVLEQIKKIIDPAVVIETFLDSTILGAKRWHPAAHAAPKSLTEANVLRFYGRYSDVHGLAQVGAESAVDLEFWSKDEESGNYQAPRHNRVVDALQEADFEPRSTESASHAPVWSRVNFPIDVVYTWVDGNDPQWKEKKGHYVASGNGVHEQAVSDARFTNRDELRYSLRSVRRFAPWVRNIFLVTDDQVPEWLSEESDVKVVSHREIFPDADCLPTYNSHAIETTLHRINGLSEHFLYCNDDTVLLRLQTPETYFTANGLAKFFSSPVKINYLESELEPHIAAAMNNRKIVRDRFDMEISQSMLHTPHPHRKSVLETIEKEQRSAVEATRRNRFRGREDISLLSSLGQYYGYGLEKYIPGSIRYTYVGLGRPETESRLLDLLNNRRLDIATFGESNDGYDDPAETDRQLHQFFEAKFSLPTRDERAESQTE